MYMNVQIHLSVKLISVIGIKQFESNDQKVNHYVIT